MTGSEIQLRTYIDPILKPSPLLQHGLSRSILHHPRVTHPLKPQNLAIPHLPNMHTPRFKCLSRLAILATIRSDRRDLLAPVNQVIQLPGKALPVALKHACHFLEDLVRAVESTRGGKAGAFGPDDVGRDVSREGGDVAGGEGGVDGVDDLSVGGGFGVGVGHLDV
jgi:hypothetical protein